MGLIAQGNQEVIEDKIARVGARGMVIFDRIGPKSNAYQTAADNQVAFIQIRIIAHCRLCMTISQA